MLLAEDRIDLLVERLREMVPADRRAILGRLTPDERKRIEALSAGAANGQPWSGDIADRVTDPSRLTDATRRALARAVVAHRPTSGRSLVVVAPSAPSLFDAVRQWVRGRR